MAGLKRQELYIAVLSGQHAPDTEEAGEPVFDDSLGLQPLEGDIADGELRFLAGGVYGLARGAGSSG